MLERLETTESARCSPAGEFTLHRFTLSDLFIIALWTNPPIPLVGDSGRVGDVRPGGDISLWLLLVSGVGGSSRWAGLRISGEPSFARIPGEDGRISAASLNGSAEVSRDIPGSCARSVDM